MVNAKFDSDRAYGVRSGSKGNRGHTDGLDGVRSDSHCNVRKHPRCPGTLHIKKRHKIWYYKIFDTIFSTKYQSTDFLYCIPDVGIEY